MKITILWIGKTKQNFIEHGIRHYIKLLKPIVSLEIEEIRETKDKEIEEILLSEGKRILKRTQTFYLLDQQGRHYSSEEFATFMKNSIENERIINFIIGGPFGVSKEIKEKSKQMIAISKMTLTHELTRVVFLEQLYRSFTINMGKEYHN
ncbi:MAG: 23S rRNA (pseudouridine(1915)-N(3))-methyltransferase RlmH [Thermodesulfovibrionales bacterium]|nr:23S rRNA (pseudouridine(1915)-N(3))-methyltransferase RlmH [Thermodesulfovibrionales bacterium]